MHILMQYSLRINLLVLWMQKFYFRQESSFSAVEEKKNLRSIVEEMKELYTLFQAKGEK